MIPYLDSSFDLYPGNLVNACETDYREEIDKKTRKPGTVSFQKCD